MREIRVKWPKILSDYTSKSVIDLTCAREAATEIRINNLHFQMCY